MTLLERGQLWVMRIHALIAAACLVAAATVANLILRETIGLPFGLIAGPILLLVLYPALIAPARHYRSWGYDMDGRDLHIVHGVWTQVETVVPLSRVQHIDVSQGPLERANGVCRLILHTAGTQHSRVVLPGLSRETAESMRDEVRAHIRRVAA